MMDYEKVILHGYGMYVRETFKKESVQAFLLNHERLPKLVSNLTRELKNADKIIAGYNTMTEYKREFIKKLIRDFSKMFCKVAIDEITIKRKLHE